MYSHDWKEEGGSTEKHSSNLRNNITICKLMYHNVNALFQKHDNKLPYVQYDLRHRFLSIVAKQNCSYHVLINVLVS